MTTLIAKFSDKIKGGLYLFLFSKFPLLN